MTEKQPTKHRLSKWILGIVGALTLGILGNALWETCVRPLFGWLGSALFSIVTLGIQSYRDGLYIDAANRPHEPFARTLWSIGSGLFSGMAISLYLKVNPKIMNRLGTFVQGNTSDANRPYSRTIEWLVPPATAFVLIFMAARSYSMGTTASIIANFDQRLEIVGPFLSESERLIYKSRFSSMRTEMQYQQIMLELVNDGTAAMAKFTAARTQPSSQPAPTTLPAQ